MRSFIILVCLFISAIFKAQNVTYYLQPSANMDIEGSWNTMPNGSGTLATTFMDNSDTFIITNNTPIATLSTPWFIQAAVVVGDGINPVTLILGVGSSMPIGPQLSVLSNATLDIQSGFNLTDLTINSLPYFDIGSTVNFGSNSPDIIDLGVDYGNVVINKPMNLGSPHVSIGGTLTINSGKILSLLSNTLTLSGSITCLGEIDGGTNQVNKINFIGGTGGTIKFVNGGRRLASLSMSLATSNDVLTLASDLTLDLATANFNLTQGKLNLNGNTFTSNNITNFGSSGAIMGSASSTFSLGTTSGITGPLFMDPSANTLKSLVVNKTGQSLTLGNALNITDSLSVLAGSFNTGGVLTLKSTSALKGRIGQVGGSITGSVTVETFIPGGTTGWANLGVPGISGQNLSSWDTYVLSNGTSGVPMTCVGCTYDPTVTGTGTLAFASVQDWDEPTLSYTELTYNSPLTPGIGHWVYVGDGQNSTNDLLLINKGLVVQGSGSIPITKTTTSPSIDNGYNLISNPYASPIAWTKLLALGTNSSEVTSSIYGWNADVSGGASSYFNGTISVPSGANSIGNILPAGQAFYVEKLATGNSSIVYDETIKTANNTGSNSLQRTAGNTDYGLVRLSFKGAYDGDETAFLIHQDATAYFDKSMDAHKLFQSPGYVGYPGAYTKYTTISSKDAQQEDYSIQCIPPLVKSINIPVLTRVSTTGSYTISAFDFKNLSVCVGLIDKLNNTYHDLRLSPYVFNISDTTSTPRFELVLCKDESLNATGISEASQSSNIFITQDAQGAYVKTVFDKNTKALISVYNVIGQKLINDISVEGTVTTTNLPIDLHNQVVIVKVSSDKESMTKKIVLH